MFIADCDGVLASSLVRTLAAPGVDLALHAGYRKGIDQLIEVARSRGAKAISVGDEAPDAEQSPLQPAAARCVRELGRIDLAVQADLPDVAAFPRTISNPGSLLWWTRAWQELQTSADLIAGVAPQMARGGRVVLLVPSRSPQAGPLFAAAAAAFDSLLPAARAELEQGGVSLGTVAVEPVDLGDWQCFQPTPSALDAVVEQVVAAAAAQ